jgi:8-oxo-dGTP pyrophosphatase MutT (NUDIX family)
MTAKVRPWNKLKEYTLQKTVVFDVLVRQMQSPDGATEADFYSIECRDWVNIVPITSDGKIILVEQFRHGIQGLTLEIPGGIIGPKHTPEQAAVAELEEETGYGSSDFSFLGAFHPNPAIQTNLAHLYLAQNCRPISSGQRLDELEDISIHLVPLGELAALVDSGRVSHCLSLAALYQVHNRFPEIGI